MSGALGRQSLEPLDPRGPAVGLPLPRRPRAAMLADSRALCPPPTTSTRLPANFRRSQCSDAWDTREHGSPWNWPAAGLTLRCQPRRWSASRGSFRRLLPLIESPWRPTPGVRSCAGQAPARPGSDTTSHTGQNRSAEPAWKIGCRMLPWYSSSVRAWCGWAMWGGAPAQRSNIPAGICRAQKDIGSPDPNLQPLNGLQMCGC